MRFHFDTVQALYTLNTTHTQHTHPAHTQASPRSTATTNHGRTPQQQPPPALLPPPFRMPRPPRSPYHPGVQFLPDTPGYGGGTQGRRPRGQGTVVFVVGASVAYRIVLIEGREGLGAGGGREEKRKKGAAARAWTEGGGREHRTAGVWSAGRYAVAATFEMYCLAEKGGTTVYAFVDLPEGSIRSSHHKTHRLTLSHTLKEIRQREQQSLIAPRT